MIETITYDTDNLGCVMLGCEPLTKVDEVIPKSLWFSNDKVNGRETEPHITLLYGLLTPAYLQEEKVNNALKEWREPEEVTLRGFDFFPGSEYDVLIARVYGYTVTSVEKAHGLLSALPHINTFHPYRPHLTLGYVPSGAGPLLCRELDRELGGGTFRRTVTGLNLGRDLRLDTAPTNS
jgi:2'-5' RNA ligase